MAEKLIIHADAHNFLTHAGAMLYTRETVNNLILGVTEQLVNNPKVYQNPFFATVRDQKEELILAAVMTPPLNLVLADQGSGSLGFAILIDHLQSHAIHVPGVIGPSQIIEPFTKTWMEMVGGTIEVNMRQRVYELHQVQMPQCPPGKFRKANHAEISTLAKWLRAFELEALGKSHNLDLERVERLVSLERIFIWELDEMIVSMAMITRPIAHSISIGSVYTPPEHRRRGYAGALVANLSQHLLDEGYQFVNLFTDLDNPTSNKIYQSVGYHFVCDFLIVRFINKLE